MTDPALWWQRPDLGYVDGSLHFAGHAVDELAARFETPAFFYAPARIACKLQQLQTALARHGFAGRHRIYYAMKANRFAPLLTWLALEGGCGIDACSPAEVDLAIACGFAAGDISFTAGSLSQKDLDRLARLPELHVNCDSLHALGEWGRRRPGTRVGIRINPGAGVSREANERLQYAGMRTTKFGIYREQFPQALEICRQFGLSLTTIHFHTGCGYLTPQLAQWQAVLERCRWFVEQVPQLACINIGGGLGIPHVAADQPLDTDRWASTLAAAFGTSGLLLQVEPGDFLVKDAGLLLVEKTYEEIKCDTRFVGVNAGFAIAPEPAHYGLPFQPVALHLSGQDCLPATVVGNINEALDVWQADVPLPPLAGETHLALINAGAYSSSMASNHCLRGDFREYLLR